ncbi:DUF3108 domain-containing protein [Paenirhodobacter populi]|uniref:DUF3108 domain-containing protein n=1 Tax=Paenirhodobacter populi TaxID=2306993 RepID=A0A443JJC7_9RHOB|nr:DUF3108 domain-containing protein [Sinirhodobacter populi]RWR20727.1 DUF3108 domain-containing protein [Sinirhodobacter populi]
MPVPPLSRARRLRRFALSALLAAFCAQGARADQTDRIVFDFSLRGITAGQLAINGEIKGNTYSASGVLKTSGFLGAIRTLRYDAQVSGRYAQGRFTPSRMDETAQRGNERVEYVMLYRNGVPAGVTRNPPRQPRESDVDPAAQGGTIDPLTALYAVLRDVDRGEACRFSAYMFDGSKRSQVTLSEPVAAGNGVRCSGEYRRIAGFSEREMREKPRFPFTLTYAPTPDGQRLRVVSIDTDTILGKGRLIRR